MPTSASTPRKLSRIVSTASERMKNAATIVPIVEKKSVIIASNPPTACNPMCSARVAR